MRGALAYDLDLAGRQAMLPHRPSQQQVCDLSKHLHVVPSVSPSSHQQHGADMASTTSGKSPRTLGERISSALWSRVGHSITRKQLQHAIQVSDGTMDKLLAGRGDPSGRVLDDLVAFFGPSFLSEIYGHLGIVVVKPADSTRKVAEGLAELSQTDPTLLSVLVEAAARARAGK